MNSFNDMIEEPNLCNPHLLLIIVILFGHICGESSHLINFDTSNISKHHNSGLYDVTFIICVLSLNRLKILFFVNFNVSNRIVKLILWIGGVCLTSFAVEVFSHLISSMLQSLSVDLVMLVQLDLWYECGGQQKQVAFSCSWTSDQLRIWKISKIFPTMIGTVVGFLEILTRKKYSTTT